MPCDTILRQGQTLEQRMQEVQRALRALEQKLLGRTASVTIAPNGAVVFQGWTPEERVGVNDACAYRALAADNSWALRQAVARAQQLSGRQVNPRAVASGLHSHDGGATWGRH